MRNQFIGREGRERRRGVKREKERTILGVSMANVPALIFNLLLIRDCLW